MRRMMIGGAIVALASGIVVAAPELLFKATFDMWNTAPDVAVEKGVLKEGIDPELQLRMHPDVSDGHSGNALSLTTPEFVSYPLPGNLRPDRGSISFWVKPCNYTLSDNKYFQMFFRAEAPEFALYIYKYYTASGAIMFYIRTGKRVKTVYALAKNWKEGEWHKLDAVWDPNGMQLFADGRLTERYGDFGPETVIDPPLALPRTLQGGWFALNDSKHFSSPEGRTTVFDEVEIRSRKLSAQEVFENFVRKRPDLAAGLSASKTELDDKTVKMTLRTILSERKVFVKLDLYALNAVNPKDVPVRLSLVERSTGRTVVTSDVVFKNPDSEVAIELPDDLPIGTYDFRGEIPSENIVSKMEFHVVDAPFLKNRVAVDESVPAPWFPVKSLSGNAFEVLDRKYAFDRGVFPRQIVARGQDLFTCAPTLRVDGVPVRWNAANVEETHPDRVVLSAAGTVGELTFSGRVEMWFDGFCLIRLKASPQSGSAIVNRMQLTWATPLDVARYLLAPTYRPWKDGSFSGIFGLKGKSGECPIVWTTGVNAGLAWWCESAANWVCNGESPNVRLSRSEKTVDVALDIIARQTSVTQSLDYVMGLQGTPSKRPDRSYRNMNYGLGKDNKPLKETNWLTCGWTSPKGVYAPDNMIYWTSLSPSHPDAFAKFLASLKAKGISEFPYSMPAHLARIDPLWDLYSEMWLQQPGFRWAFTDELTKKRSEIAPCCPNSGAGDWHLSNMKRLLCEFQDVGGLYFDISNVGQCSNELHGHGGIDAFGRKYASSTALALREYFLRIRKLCNAHGKPFHVHAHNTYYPFVHSWADACWPGEEQFRACSLNPEYHYVEGISDEAYQAEWNPDIRGMGVFSLPQNHRVAGYHEELAAKNPESYYGRASVFGAILPSLIYDFRCLGMFGPGSDPLEDTWRVLRPLHMERATFFGHWFRRVAHTADGIRTALYTWKAGEGPVPFLLVVGNFTRHDLATNAKIDWRALGVAPTVFMDLLTGVKLTEKELNSYRLMSRHYLLLTPVSSASVNN